MLQGDTPMHRPIKVNSKALLTCSGHQLDPSTPGKDQPRSLPVQRPPVIEDIFIKQIVAEKSSGGNLPRSQFIETLINDPDADELPRSKLHFMLLLPQNVLSETNWGIPLPFLCSINDTTFQWLDCKKSKYSANFSLSSLQIFRQLHELWSPDQDSRIAALASPTAVRKQVSPQTYSAFSYCILLRIKSPILQVSATFIILGYMTLHLVV